ncbi:MAG: chitobiase/beta-hexosaminidase C-terminal domain-containing protein [Bacteroidales bacterium]|nr:chitobiase/beta-hexosaminidase C-terminal domain-containing protein [Bacteroidales bacterium]MBQ6741419.1 chitobiase/beta-hexosaminidase C-terminal domain-containing protein [Bacteroidales bacterium]
MKRNFTRILAAFALLVGLTIPMGVWGQGNYSATYSSNCTLTAGTNGSSCTINVGTEGYNGIKVGTSSKGGDMSVTVPAGAKYLHIHVAAWNGVTNLSLNITPNENVAPTSIALTANSGIANNSPFTFSGDPSTSDYYKVITFTEALTSETVLTFTTSIAKRFVIWGVNSEEEGSNPPTPTCATPTFNPAAGTYTEAQTVTISCATEGATIYYTTNGDEPTTSSTVYANPISVSSNMTIKAMAAAQGYDNSAVATAEYIFEAPSFNQDWEGTMHGWTFVSVTGDQVWSIGTYSNNKYAKMSGYSNGNNANEDWCISPAFNLGDYTNPVLTFTTARSQHNGNELEVYFSNNYNGDPSSATWTQLTCTLPAQPSSGYSEFTSSGNISLSSYSGSNCYIGFKYTSTNDAAATWELDDIVLASQTITPTITLTPSSIDLGNNNPTEVQISKTFTVSQSNLTEGIVLNASIGDLTTTTIAQGAEDTEITWTYTPTEAGSISATITATSTGAETQTLTITGAAVAPVTGDRYEMVTEAPQDWSGCYIITGTNSGDYYALTGVTSNLGTTAAVTVVGNSIESNSTTDGYQVIVAQTTNGYSLYMDGVGYLGYNSDATTSNNYLHALESFEANTCEWTIAMTDGLATITNVRNNARSLQFNYNNGNSRFACYTSSQVKPTLFKYTGTVVLPPVINVTENTVSLEYNETEGSIEYTITNPVLGTNLIATSEADWIEDITVGESAVTFTATENESTEDRTATITLSYTGAVDKVITINQAAYVAPFEPTTYTLATSIESGKTYIITDGLDRAMGVQNGTVRSAADVTIDESTATVNTADVYEFVISGNETDGYTIFDSKASGYLYASSSSSNNIGTRAENSDANSMWAIESGDENGVTITAKGDKTRNSLRYNYNQGNDRFSCYGSNSSLNATLYLFVKEETPTNPTITVNGYGDTNGGYVLLAWPESTSPTAINGMISDNLGAQVTPETPGTYDLYSYDESQAMEWRNYRTNSFELVPGKGYLYASKAGVTLTYEGEADPEFTDVDLPYTDNKIIKSIYLAGNSKTNEQTFYVYNSELAKQTFNYLTMNEDGNGFISAQATSYTAPAMTGFFVQAPGANMTLSTTDVNAKANASLLNINVLRSRGSVIDNAIVSFSNGSMMDKFYLMNNTTRVYIPQGNREMAIANSAAQGEMPVSFRASENGTYTIAVEAENVDMNYLHLIDNMTGADVDLLATPNYTFEARTNDYTSRFRLVFSANGIDEQTAETFAFFNGTSWTVSNTGDATLQVVDITGRIVSSETINGNATISLNQPAGIYMLRLVNGNDVKVQKVVVR